jgi:hypothetical protein
MVNIPMLYRTEKIDLNGHELVLGGFRASDFPHVKIIDHNQNQRMRIQGLLNVLTNGKEKDTDYSKEEILEIMDMRDEALELNNGIKDLRSIIAQRGLKRFYYKNEPEFKQAEKEGTLTDYIDSLEDVPLDLVDELTVYNAMSRISKTRRPLDFQETKEKDLTEKPGNKSKKKSKISTS